MSASSRLRLYVASRYPVNLDDAGDNIRQYLTGEYDELAKVIKLFRDAVFALDTVHTPLTNAANDAAAAAAGVPVNGLYHNAGAVRMRLV